MDVETGHRTGEAGLQDDTGGDGRTARRDRNRTAVLDAVLALFCEDNLSPSPEEVARRSGASLRSVYRYVSDADDLIRSAIARHIELVQPLFAIEDMGEGSFAQRLERFVDLRLRLYDAIAATARAASLRAPRNDAIRNQLAKRRRLLHEQAERQFAPELERLGPDERVAVLAAVDALTQIETLDLYRHLHGHSAKATRDMLTVALRALLTRRY